MLTTLFMLLAVLMVVCICLIGVCEKTNPSTKSDTRVFVDNLNRNSYYVSAHTKKFLWSEFCDVVLCLPHLWLAVSSVGFSCVLYIRRLACWMRAASCKVVTASAISSRAGVPRSLYTPYLYPQTLLALKQN